MPQFMVLDRYLGTWNQQTRGARYVSPRRAPHNALRRFRRLRPCKLPTASTSCAAGCMLHLTGSVPFPTTSNVLANRACDRSSAPLCSLALLSHITMPACPSKPAVAPDCQPLVVGSWVDSAMPPLNLKPTPPPPSAPVPATPVDSSVLSSTAPLTIGQGLVAAPPLAADQPTNEASSAVPCKANADLVPQTPAGPEPVGSLIELKAIAKLLEGAADIFGHDFLHQGPLRDASDDDASPLLPLGVQLCLTLSHLFVYACVVDVLFTGQPIDDPVTFLPPVASLTTELQAFDKSSTSQPSPGPPSQTHAFPHLRDKLQDQYASLPCLPPPLIAAPGADQPPPLPYHVSCITWNMMMDVCPQGQPSPPGSGEDPSGIQALLHPENHLHLVVVATQECWSSIAQAYVHADKTEWEKRMTQALGHRDLAKWVRCTETAVVPRKMRRKGAVALQIQVRDISFLFVNCHFSPHQERMDHRNADFNHVFNKLSQCLPRRRPPGRTSDVLGSDVCFWMGDLNYRVNCPSYLCTQLLEDAKWMEVLVSNDQLRISRTRGHSFSVSPTDHFPCLECLVQQPCWL
eukprot:gene2019-475_t